MQKSEKLTHDSQEPLLVVQMQTPFLPVCFLHACLWAHTHFFGLQWVCVCTCLGALWGGARTYTSLLGVSMEMCTYTCLCWFLRSHASTHIYKVTIKRSCARFQFSKYLQLSAGPRLCSRAGHEHGLCLQRSGNGQVNRHFRVRVEKGRACHVYLQTHCVVVKCFCYSF